MRLQRRLFLIISPPGLLSVVAIFAAVYGGMHEKAQRDIVRQVELSLQKVASLHDNALQSSASLLSLVAADPAIIAAAQAPHVNDRDTTAATAALARYQRAQPAITGLSLIGVHGEIKLFSGERLQRKDERDQQIRDGRMFESAPVLDDGLTRYDIIHVESRSAIELSRTLYPAESGYSQGAPIGFLKMELDLLELDAAVATEVLVAGGELQLLDEYGQVILCTETSSRGDPDAASFDDLQNRFKEGSPLTVLVDEHEAITGHQWLTGNLRLVATLPRSSVFDSIAGLTYRLGAASAIGTFMGICSFFVLLRFLVMRPLIQVRENAMQIGLGGDGSRMGMTTAIHRTDEIGDLSRAFDSTSRRLAASIDELQSSNDAIERLAYRDALTGLPNRRLFHRAIAARLEAAKAQSGRFSVLYLDLDNFKDINDLQGHDAGDHLLKVIGSRLSLALAFDPEQIGPNSIPPRGNLVARLGGDEFVAFVDSTDGGQCTAEETAKRLLEVITVPVVHDDQEFLTSVSIGVAHYPDHGDTMQALNRSADTAMYEAKRMQKNSMCVYENTMRTALEERVQLEADARAALEKNEFSLLYQPKFCIRTSRLSGAESLIRWHHPVRGAVSPDMFIPVIEASGLIDAVGQWVLDEACRQWREWTDEGLDVGHVAVNVSIRQFEICDLFVLVEETLQRYDMPASALEIELTETCVMEAYEEVRETLEGLRAIGVSVALDDFGTGYSSLGIIANMPIDTVKVDRSFVSGLTPDSSNAKIVSTVVALAHQLNMRVVAEGVETDAEFEFLRDRNCDIAQGFLLSKPLTAGSMTFLLKSTKESKAA